jgi:excisionase family DNA binding protein
MKKREHDWYFATEPLGAREKLVTKKQLANYLGVTTRTLEYWRAQGRIPYWRISPRAIRYELSSVERALSKPNLEE